MEFLQENIDTMMLAALVALIVLMLVCLALLSRDSEKPWDYTTQRLLEEGSLGTEGPGYKAAGYSLEGVTDSPGETERLEEAFRKGRQNLQFRLLNSIRVGKLEDIKKLTEELEYFERFFEGILVRDKMTWAGLKEEVLRKRKREEVATKLEEGRRRREEYLLDSLGGRESVSELNLLADRVEELEDIYLRLVEKDDFSLEALLTTLREIEEEDLEA